MMYNLTRGQQARHRLPAGSKTPTTIARLHLTPSYVIRRTMLALYCREPRVTHVFIWRNRRRGTKRLIRPLHIATIEQEKKRKMLLLIKIIIKGPHIENKISAFVNFLHWSLESIATVIS